MIRDIEVRKDHSGKIQSVHVTFGHHHFVEIVSDGKTTTFAVGATHHGFRADASDVPSELERLCDEIRRTHPANAID